MDYFNKTIQTENTYRCNVRGHFVTSSLDGDILVFGEVNAGIARAEQFQFDTFIARKRDRPVRLGPPAVVPPVIVAIPIAVIPAAVIPSFRLLPAVITLQVTVPVPVKPSTASAAPGIAIKRVPILVVVTTSTASSSIPT